MAHSAVVDEQIVNLPPGAPTSVGSLPHLDRDAAIDFVLTATPALPTVPTCPMLEPLEHMVPQAAWGIAGVEIADDGTISIPEPDRIDPAAPLGDRELVGPPFTTWRRFLERVAGRTEPVTLRMTGPVTLGLCLLQAGLDADRAFEIAGRAVSARAADVCDLADRLAPDVPRVLVFDEPGLVGGLRPGLPLDADRLIDLLSASLARVESRALTGVHCCGPTDWRLITQAGPRLLSLPVGAELVASAGTLATFLEQGGWIVWGAINADGPLGEQASLPWRQLSAQWCELVQSGCDPLLLRRQALVSPVCGLALHEVHQAEHVFDLTRDVAERIRTQMMGVKLSVGA